MKMTKAVIYLSQESEKIPHHIFSYKKIPHWIVFFCSNMMTIILSLFIELQQYLLGLFNLQNVCTTNFQQPNRILSNRWPNLDWNWRLLDSSLTVNNIIWQQTRSHYSSNGNTCFSMESESIQLLYFTSTYPQQKIFPLHPTPPTIRTSSDPQWAMALSENWKWVHNKL